MSYNYQLNNINLIFFTILIAFIVFVLIYFKILKKYPFHLKFLILFSRILVLISLLIFFINPIVSFKDLDITNPKINIFLDNSLSMNKNLENIDFNIDDIFNELEDWSLKNNISLKYYKFGEKFKKIDNLNLINFSENKTNYSTFFEYMHNNNMKDDVILISDGLNNYGKINFNYNFNNKIYTLGIGNESSNFDDISLKLERFNYKNDDTVDLLLNINCFSTNDFQKKYILLNNELKINHIIDSLNFIQGYSSFKKKINIPKNHLSQNNLFNIQSLENEINIENNKINVYFDKTSLIKKKALLITGGLSNNTLIIKDKIIKNLSEYNFKHIFRIVDDIWSSEFDELENLNNYDLIIFDNYPTFKKDDQFIDQVLENFQGKIIYFIGPNFSFNNDSIIFDMCNCDIKVNNINLNNEKIITLNNQNFVIAPHSSNYYINCFNKNSVNYNNKNCIFTESNNYLYFFFDDLYKLNQNNLIDAKYNLNELISAKIDTFLYDRSKTIDILVHNNEYFNDEEIQVFLRINKPNIKFSDVYLELSNSNSSTLKNIYTKTLIDTNFYKFILNVKDVGQNNIKGIITLNDNQFVESNVIFINVFEKQLETKNIYLNSMLLKNISKNSDAYYSNYSNIESLLDKIDIGSKEQHIFHRKTMFSYSYLWILLILFFSVEWYLRNKIGLL